MKFVPAFVAAWFFFCGFTLLGTLRWKINSTDEDGFIVEQSVGAGPYVELTRVEAGATFYEVEITESRKVCWRIRAFNVAGNSAPLSPRCVSRWSVTIN